MEIQAESAHKSDSTLQTVLLMQTYNRTSIGVIATVVNITILVFLLRNVVSHTTLSIYYVLVLIAALFRQMVSIHYRHHPERIQSIRTPKNLLITSVGMSGILWGATAVVIFPGDSVTHQALIGFVLAGMVAGAVGVFSAILPVFLAFSIPTLTPLFIRFLLIGDEIHLAMGVMTFLFGILTFFTAKRINLDTRELVLLKETFAGMLEKRTTELRGTNLKLEEEVEKRRETEKVLRVEHEKLQLMFSEIKTLRGFIPICSVCKKIRDDEGFWQKIEKYIQEHSEARFSHGICPECLKTTYPELEDEDIDDS
jgi:hypothetical protein